MNELPKKRFVDAKFLAVYLGFSEASIQEWAVAKKIPHYKVVGRLRFDLQQIDEWLKKCFNA